LGDRRRCQQGQSPQFPYHQCNKDKMMFLRKPKTEPKPDHTRQAVEALVKATAETVYETKVFQGIFFQPTPSLFQHDVIVAFINEHPDTAALIDRKFGCEHNRQVLRDAGLDYLADLVPEFDGTDKASAA
jgi:hypothetical protein